MSRGVGKEEKTGEKGHLCVCVCVCEQFSIHQSSIVSLWVEKAQ